MELKRSRRPEGNWRALGARDNDYAGHDRGGSEGEGAAGEDV